MAFIDTENSDPGIVGLMKFRPETAQPLCALAQTLLQGSSTLTKGERELIATVVSRGNHCKYCTSSHAAIAAEEVPGGTDEVWKIVEDNTHASGKMRALLRIAEKVRDDGRSVTKEDVTAARAEGASDTEIHDTVLIAAAFCMYNRYVDGLGTLTAEDDETYQVVAKQISTNGYLSLLEPGAG